MASTTSAFPSGNLAEQTQWLSDLLSKQQAMFGSFGLFGGAVPGMGESAPQGDAATQMMAPWLEMAKSLAALQQQGLQQMTDLGKGMMPDLSAAFGDAANAAKDKRFAGEAWQKDPRFDITAKTYLAQTTALQKALDAAPLDERLKGQWGFMLRQVIDALSPANWLATNPEAIQTALDSGGQSLVEGTKLFMQDLAKGRISMTDETAFEVGRNVALTPGTVVFENELIQLIQYAPTHRQGARAAAGDRAALHQQVLHPRPAAGELVRRATRVVAGPHGVPRVLAQRRPRRRATLTWDDYVEKGVMTAHRGGARASPAPTRSTRSASASAARCCAARSA